MINVFQLWISVELTLFTKTADVSIQLIPSSFVRHRKTKYSMRVPAVVSAPLDSNGVQFQASTPAFHLVQLEQPTTRKANNVNALQVCTWVLKDVYLVLQLKYMTP